MPETVPAVGEFAWQEMMADDPEASLAFYTRLFGWEKKHAMDMGKDGTYQMYGLGDFTYGGFMRRQPGQPAAFWNSYVRVTDLDASVAAVKRGGGTIVMGPHEVPNDDRVVVAIDDQGAVISLVGRKR
jgi:predicted enzyme related to lactoylglutathione lyase